MSKILDIQQGTLGHFNPNGKAYKGKATAFKTINGNSVILVAADIAILNKAASAIQYGRKVDLDPAMCQDVIVGNADHVEITFDQPEDDEEL